MKKFQKALDKVIAAIGATLGDLHSAQKRWRHLHDAAHKNHNKASKLRDQAAVLIEHGHPLKAKQARKRAGRKQRKADKIHEKMGEELIRIHRLKDKRDNLQDRKAYLEGKIKESEGKYKLHIDGNLVKGDAPIGVKAMYAWHVRGASGIGFRYSQVGAFYPDKFITGEPSGARQDCSQAVIAARHSAGAKVSPSGSWTAGFTGSLADHGVKITQSEARKTPGSSCEWGSYPYHHIEDMEGDGTGDTMGHGSPPYDRGSDTLLGPADAYFKHPE